MKKPTKAPDTTSTKSPSRLERWLLWIFIVCGVVGVLASAIITIEKFEILKNPGTVFICDLNPVISCGSVMQSEQANTFGFMNTFIGLVGFPILVTVGVAMLAGAQFKRWFWLGMEAGLFLGVVFAYWLLYQSTYSIGALCPYCLTVDVVITTAFWYLTLYIIGKGWLPVPARLRGAAAFARRHHVDILVFWFLLMVVLILQHFWYYFGRNF
jgi:uncharacterized membrane protein